MKKLLILLSISMMAHLSFSQAQKACFSSRNDFSFVSNGSNSRSMTYGDFDNDGHIDLVTAYYFLTANEKFIFHKGQGNGKFVTAASCGAGTTGTVTYEVKSGDLNLDGNLDVIYSNNNGVNIYYGQGDGTFTFITTLPLLNCKYIGLGDFDQNDTLDIVATMGNNKFTYFQKNSAGGPTSYLSSTIVTVTGNINRIEVGDMNGDSYLDVVSATLNGGTSYVCVSKYNSGSNNFDPVIANVVTGANKLVDLTLVDLNGISGLDVASVDVNNNLVFTVLNNGSGNLSSVSSYSVEESPNGITHGDLDQDGDMDVVAVNTISSTLSIFKNNGSGALSIHQTVQCPGSPYDVAISNFNGDTYPDISTCQGSGAYLNSFLGNASANFQETNLFNLAGKPTSIYAADFNGDSKGDYAVLDSIANLVRIYLGNGASGFTVGATYATGTSPIYITGGDISNDGNVDLVVVNNGSNDISVFYGTGSGTFSAGVTHAVGTTPVQAKIGNLNGDAYGDIVVTNNGSSNISVLNSTGSTTHAAAVTIAAGYTNPYAVVILDYDLDGKKDVIISSSNGLKTLNRFKGDGAGGLTANGTVGLSSANYSSVKSLEAKDVDGDGDEDIFVGETGQLGKIANPGVTSGSAATNTTFFIKNTTTPGISGEIRGIHIVDVNNDGKLDAVAVFNSGPFNVGLIGVAIATSFGTNAGYVFTANSKAFASETNGSGIGMADFNSDGKIDAIISNQSSNSTTLHLNTTPTITAGGPTTFCNGNLVQLTSSAADFWYEWSPTLETTQSINAVTTGNYFVTTSSSWSDWCTSESDTITVTVTAGPTAPTITAGGSTTICGSGTVTLTSSSPTGNQWFLDGDTISGATSQNYVASVGGTYTVTFNNGTCSSDESNAITVTVSQAPIITAGGPTTFCNGGSVVLTSDVNSNITWSPGGETTQNITVTSSGSYYVTNTVAGCPPINSNTIVVTVTTVPTPTITASGPITFCAGGSVTLTSSSATGNTWSTGATTQSINVTTSGSYYVYVTSGGCNSANSSVVNVTVNAIPSTPTITASGPTTFCAGGSVTLTSSAGSSYLWSNGATTQSINVTTSGSYSVQVTNAAGCQSLASTPTTVTVNSLPATPTITAGGPTTFCAGGSVTLTSSAGSSYLWSNGATTSSINVTTSGTYTVQVTNAAGCQSPVSSGTVVTVNSLPSAPTITPSGSTSICAGSSVTLTSSAGNSYLWSNGATTSSINVNTAGSYTVQITDANGCQSPISSATTVTVNALPPAPTITAGGPTTFCTGGSVTLTSSAGNSYLWSTGATTSSINVTSSGTYTVQITDANGCQSPASAATTVTVNPLPAPPTITAGGPTTFCAGGSVNLTSSAGVSYLWSTGATTSSINVTTSGTYTVQVTNSNGCLSSPSAATTVTVNALPATPTISAGGPTTFCAGGSVVLTAPASSGYLWSPGGQTTQAITVTASGSYSVQVTNSNGCQSAASAPVVVTVNALPSTPTITAGGPTTFCAGGSVTLTSSAGNSYLWSTGATTSSINVTTSGSYTVQVTDANGCTSLASSATTVTVNSLPATPTITAGGPTTFCAGGSVTLSAPTATSYLWAPGGETTQSIIVTTSGSYTVQVTNAFGCQSAISAAVNVTVNSIPSAPTVTASGPTTFCAGGSVVLTSSVSSGNLWSPGNQTTQSITVSTSGTYSVTQTVSGCTSPASTPVVVTVNALPPTPSITAGGPTTFCAGGSVTLSAPTSTSYLWSPGGQTTQNITVSTSGSHTVQVTDANGCTSAVSAPVNVTVNALPATPTISAGGPTTFCAGGSVVLTAPASSGYLWSPGGQTTQAITVTASGSYTVQVTNSNGCQSAASAPVVVTVNALPSTPTITAGGPTTFCAGGSVTLSAPTSTSYLWSPGGQTTQNITVSTSGTYTVQVGDVNGCMSLASSAVTVTVNPVPSVPTVTANGPTTFCLGDSVILTSSAAAGYLWAPGGQTTQSITVTASGVYSVKVTNAFGCQSMSSALTSVTVNPIPSAPTITASGPTTFCAGGSVILTSSASSGNLWSPGNQTTQSITVSTSGTYSVTQTVSGCTSPASTPVVVTVNALPSTPVITAGGPTTFCAGGSVTLSAPTSTSYLWSPGGQTTQNITVSTSGSHTVQVTDANGCTSAVSAPVNVTVNALPATPTISAGGPTTFCAGGSVVLTAPASSGYLWSPGGQTTQAITVTASGSYSVQVTNSNGCQSAASTPVVVTVNALPSTPTITAGGPTTFCAGGSVTLSAPTSTSYLWSPGGQTTQNITVSTSGTYTVQVGDVNGCMSLASSAVTVTVNPVPSVPTVTANGPTTFCLGDSVILTSSAAAGYLWAPGGQTTQSITVTASGVYSVKVTNAFGCQSMSSALTSVTVNPIPSAPAITASGPTTFCAGGSVILTSSVSSGNLWSPGNQTTQSITVSTSGTYSVTQTVSGCTSPASTPVVVTVNALPSTPVITAGGPTTFCVGDSVVLSAPTSAGYLWSPGGQTTQSITVHTAGSYTVQVTDGNGCTSLASSPKVVTVNALPVTPTISAGGPTTFCAGGSVVLTAPASSGYLWSPGGQTTQAITVTASGSYSVQVTNSNGCQSAASAPVVVTVNALPTTPTITAGGPTTFCAGGSVTLTSSAGNSYLWSPGSATTQSINVTTSGIYTVKVTDGNGCQSLSSAPMTVTVNALPATPTITAGGPTTFCAGGSVVLSAPVASNYLWAPGNETTQSITVTNSGSYTVQVIDANGCQSAFSSPMTVTVNPIPPAPVITAGGPTTFCAGGSVVLTSSYSTGNLWTPGNLTTQSITVSTSGTYSVTATVAGCTSPSASQVVVVNPLPTTPNITAGGPTTFCMGDSVVLSAPTSAGYLWSPGGQTTQSITVYASGSYTVQVTDGNGCTSPYSPAKVVTVNSLPATPTITAGGPTTFCLGGSVTLTAPTSTSYLWSTGATTQSINATASGSYSVQVININGCVSDTSLPVTVTVNPLPSAPSITAGGPTTFCIGGSVTLTSSSSNGYLWSPGGQSTQNITVSTSGSYTVHAIDVNGCQSVASTPVVVTVNALPPTPTITAGGPTTFCTGGSVVLTSSTGTTYIWSNGDVSQSSTISTSGSYYVQVTDANGCLSDTSLITTVTVNPIPSAPTITAGGPTTFCAGDNVILTSSASSGNLWTPGNLTTQSITVTAAGTYSVTQTVLGCTSPSSSIVITVNPIPPAPTVTASGPITFCAGGSVDLTSSISSNILWNTSETTQTITVNSSGLYSVTQTVLGCTSNPSTPVNVVVNPIPPVPTITAGGPTALCAGGSVVLTSSSATNNNWSTGATTQSITVSAAGTYIVQVIQSGCTSGPSAPVNVTVNPLPNAPTIVTGTSETICAGNSVTLTSSSSSGNIWSTAETTQSISVSTAGTYTVQVVDGNGCTSPPSAPTTVTVFNAPAAPIVTTSQSPNLCVGETVDLTSSYTSGNTWSSGSTANTITVSTSGSYTVTYTDVNGCISAPSIPVNVVVNPIPAAPTVTAGGPTTFCAGGSVTLTSSESSGNVWSNTEVTPSVVITSSGVYSVMFVDNNGCSSPSSIPVVVNVLANPPSPTITAGGPTTVCQGSTVTLTSSYTSGNTWSTGSNLQNINVGVSGSYTVTYTNINGCTSTSAPTTVTIIPTSPIPTISASGSTTICQGSSVTLTSSDPTSIWSTGANSQSITVTTSGSYSVTGNSTGCPSAPSAPIVVTVNPTPAIPTITPSGPTTICQGEELFLFTPATGTISWSTGYTGPVLNVTSAGNYYVSVSNAYGCSASSASVTVVINPLPNVALNPFGTVCLNAAPFTLSNGIPAGGNYTGNGITSNVFNPSVMGVGSSIVTYTYTDINGCSGEAQGIITVSDCLGLDEESVQFALFPNPTAGKFTITSNIVPIDQVVIYDAQGKMVYNENYAGIMHAEFDMNAYSNGVYYIEIRNNNELQSRMPLVINH